MKKVYLGAIGQAFGGRVAFKSALNDQKDKLVSSLLERAGFRGFLRSERNIFELASVALKNCLAQACLSSEELDAVIFCTESFWDINLSAEASQNIHQLISSRLKLRGAYIYGHWLSGCANFSSAICLARSLIASSQHQHIAVILSDRVKRGRVRIDKAGNTVFSDGATAFLVSGRNGNYLIHDIILHPYRPCSKGGDGLALAKAKIASLAELSSLIRAKKLELGKYDAFVSDNFHPAYLKLVSDVMGIEFEKIHRPPRNFGHTFSSDCPNALATLIPQLPLSKSAFIGAINIGPNGVGFSSFSAGQSP